MDACAEGRLLILAPWQHHNERIAIQRDQCLSLNEMARLIVHIEPSNIIRVETYLFCLLFITSEGFTPNSFLKVSRK